MERQIKLYLIDTDFVGEKILQNTRFRHKKYNKTEPCYERTTNESIILYSPEEVTHHDGRCRRPGIIPRALERQVYFLKQEP